MSNKNRIHKCDFQLEMVLIAGPDRLHSFCRRAVGEALVLTTGKELTGQTWRIYYTRMEEKIPLDVAL